MTCPAFGGDQLTRLFATSAAERLNGAEAAAGMTYAAQTTVRGQAEHRVLLP